LDTDRPGREVSTDHRKVIRHLVDNEGWTYKLAEGNGYPRLIPPGADQTIRVPKTGHSKGHAFENWLAEIRRNGGHWPPSRKRKQEEEEGNEE
jgi:hypothetical protein